MFSCFLSHTQIVQLIKENIAADFFGEAFASSEIREQDCTSPLYTRRGKQFLAFMSSLSFDISISLNMQLVYFIVPHTKA